MVADGAGRHCTEACTAAACMDTFVGAEKTHLHTAGNVHTAADNDIAAWKMMLYVFWSPRGDHLMFQEVAGAGQYSMEGCNREASQMEEDM